MRFGKCFVIAIALFAILMYGIMAHPAMAEDKILTAKIQQIEQKLDKNGKAYVRVFIEEQKELSGIQYRTSTAVMGFGQPLVDQMKNLKKGDTIKAVVATNEYKGRTSYNVLALIQ